MIAFSQSRAHFNVAHAIHTVNDEHTVEKCMGIACEIIECVWIQIGFLVSIAIDAEMRIGFNLSKCHFCYGRELFINSNRIPEQRLYQDGTDF